MPYKDPERQKQAAHESYLRNRDRISKAQQERRAQPGYRDGEYAARREKAAAERPARSPRPTTTAPRRTTPRPTEPSRRPRGLTPEEQAEQQRISEMIEHQRRMKEAALRRFLPPPSDAAQEQA